MKELIAIQQELKAPKELQGNGVKYKYRSCESILENLKPLLDKYKCFILLTDDIVEKSNRIYIKATATITNAEGQSISSSGYAREDDSSKLMGVAQLTGSTSSYARKYALNGLLCIDDAKDPDSEKHEERTPQQVISDKRKAVYNVMLANNTALTTVLDRYNIGDMEDLTDKQVEIQYNAWVKNGHIKESV